MTLSICRKLIQATATWLSVCLLTLAANAQTITATVTGVVTDPGGAVVSGAKVTATNVDTGVAFREATNGDGIYSIRFLPIGNYKLLAEASGFAAQSFGPFTLEIGQSAKLDLKLAVAGSTTRVDVSAALTPLLDTEDSTIATVIDANTIGNIPLNGRNWSSLTLFLPGSVATNPSSFSSSGSGNNNAIERNQFGGGNGQANINGNRAEGNNYRLDGIEINETINNLIGYNPNPDALGEIRVISANAPAEYGNVNGGDIIAVTKSGTNQYHGSLSGYLEDYKLDANTWTNKNVPGGSAVTPRNPYTQSQYSATFGGPIFRDKLFFFADYFGTRYHKGGLATATVLSAKMRSGDFSELLDPTIMCSSTGGVCASQTTLIQLYDPFNNYAPYAGNKGVPISNPVAAYLIAHPQYYPLPNLAPGSDSPVANNFRGNTKSSIHNNQFDVRVDWSPTRADRISARYLQGEAGDQTTNPLAVTFPGASSYPDKGIALNYVRTISPTIVNELRAGFTRIRWNQGNPNDTTGAFGLKGNSIVGIPGTQAFGGFSAQNIRNFTSSGNAGGGTNFIDNTFVYADDLTWQRGKHLLKTGVEFVRYQQNNFYPGNDGANGQFNYGQDGNGNVFSFTSNPFVTGATGPSGKGYSAADFLLDRAAFVGIGGVAGRTGQRQWRSAYFVQDDWKVLPTLTLNLGLRYEYFQPIYEVNNKEVNVNYATGLLEFAGKVPAGALAGSTVCPNRACYNAAYNNFMPRVGFSYQPMPRMVVRGGFGITKALEGTGANLRLTYNPPFQSSLELTGTPPSTASPGAFFQVTNGFSASANQNFGSGFYRTYDPNLQPQATNEYSLTTEYQVNNFTSVKLGYVGESSQHLVQAVARNQLTTPCYINGVVTTNPNQPACVISDPAPYQALVGQGGGLFETATEGMANYNALQASYRQRAAKGLEYTINYTYARAMTNAVGFFGIAGINGPSPYAQNAYNNSAEYGPAGSDIRHNLNGTAVYALPFGRGRQYGRNVNHLVDEAIGGWKMSMTAIVYSGFPLTIGAPSEAGTNNKTGRPNQVTNAKLSHHTLNNWFGGTDTTTVLAKYVVPANGTYGNASIGSERAPGFQQYDFSAFKDFAVFHENTLGFRVDAFNAFNVTSLSNPDTGLGDSNFGQINSVRSVPRQIQFSAKYQF